MALRFSLSDIGGLAPTASTAQPSLPFPATTGPAADTGSAVPPQAPCNLPAVVMHTDGNVVRVEIVESAPEQQPRTQPTTAAVAVSAAPAIVAAERSGAAQSAYEQLKGEHQDVIREQLEFCQRLWTLWRGGGGLAFEAAYQAVAARVAKGDFPALAQRGKFSIGVVRRCWMRKLTDPQTGAPAWDLDRLAFQYRAGAVKQSIAKALPAAYTEIFSAMYLTRGCRSVRSVWEAAATKCLTEGLAARDEIPTLEQVKYYAQTKIPRRLVNLYRTPQAEKARVGGYILRKWRAPGEIWMMDHHRLDIYCKVPIPGKADEWCLIRPWITVVRDAAAGFILSVLVYADSAPNHEKIVECLYYALVVSGGVAPRYLVIDNGMDFLRRGLCTDMILRADAPADSALEALDRAFGDVEIEDGGQAHTISIARCLGVEVRRTRNYAGRQKPVERDFRNVAGDWAKLWPAWVYCGNSPSTRPSEAAGQDRKTRSEPRNYPSVQQAQDAIEAWLVRLHATPSNGRILKGMSPAQAWANRPTLARPALPERALQLACMIPQQRLVSVRPEGPSGADIMYKRWWYHGATDADCLALGTFCGDRTKQILIKTAFNVPTFDWDGKRLPIRIWAFTTDGRFVAACEAHEEFDALDASYIPEERDGFQAACRRINLIKAQDKRRREEATGGMTERNVRPTSPIAFAGLAGVPPAPQLTQGSDDTPHALVTAPAVPGPGRGRARITAPTAGSAADAGPFATSGNPSAESAPTVKSDPTMVADLAKLQKGDFGIERPEDRIAREAAALLREEEATNEHN
ncbi:MAG: hypothetical protein A3K18_13485 [Lentisphaerae bacterium RIFOXYA12_64_32]|nr:MAG: hypothetical protein A3K18_13485 [Lentisphaerae bacterium RIFOXYA12_64_32]